MPKIQKCCILGCHESSRNVIEQITFHRIPKDEAARREWTELIISKTNQTNVFPIEAMVCSKHFEKCRFIDRVNGSRVLMKNSLPTIFPCENDESSKADWSDSEDNFVDPLTNIPSTEIPESINSTNDIAETAVQINNAVSFVKLERNEDDKNLVQWIESTEFRKNCRFCLVVPTPDEVDNSLSNEDITKMYQSLTNMTFYCSSIPVTLCTSCSSKLKSAFEFREHLMNVSQNWETFIKTQADEVSNRSSATDDDQASDLEIEPEFVLLDEKDDMIDDYSIDELPDEDEERTKESEEDEQFIEEAKDFIKTVKPIKLVKPKKPPKPPGKLISARTIAAETEKLNFRSTSSPHSSQKLKKDQKWWRLMHDCNYCDAKDFLTIDAVTKHLKLCHGDITKVTCDICKKDYSELKYLRKHMKYVHQTRQHVCTICKKSFYYNYNLKSHMLSHTNEKSVICHLCGKFFTPHSLHQHLRSGAHGGQVKDKDLIRLQNTKRQRYYCYICVPLRRFDTCADLTEHRRLVHKDFECTICKGWFSCFESLQNHLKTHSNKERKHVCSICSNTFVRASHLEGHMRRKHSSNPKTIACDQCDYRCVEQYELTGHKRHSHSNERPHRCLHCEKSFTHPQALKDHVLTTHDIGEYRYSCALCPKRFTNSANLIHHRAVHHYGAGNNAS